MNQKQLTQIAEIKWLIEDTIKNSNGFPERNLNIMLCILDQIILDCKEDKRILDSITVT